MKSVVVLVVAALLAAPAVASAEPRKITLEEAISLATEGNIQIDLAKEQLEIQEQQIAKTKTYRLPRLTVRAGLFVWNDDVPIEFLGMELGVAREQVTGNVDVIIAQPITASIVLGRLIEYEQAKLDTQKREIDVTRLDLAYQVAELYFAALQAQQLRDVANTGIKQLEASIARVKVLIDGGVLDNVDLLRLEAALARARQAVIEIDAGARSAQVALALFLHLPDGTAIEVVDVDPTPPPLGFTEDEAVAAGKAQRPEARAADARIVQAEKGIDLARGEYLPMVNLLAAYSHTEGQGAFAEKDAAYVALQLEWNLWDWGERKAGVAQARAGHRIARKARAFVDDQVASEVRLKWLAADAALQYLTVAESGLKAAEEAYRLQSARFAQGVAVTTDVLDAETEVSTARSQATIARYQYLVKWMALQRAVGATPGK